MTRDSASAPGPETDSEKDVTEAPEATEKTSPDAAEAGTTGDKATPVAVDTTDDEPGEAQDTTDEGAIEAAKEPAATSSDAEPEKSAPKNADLTLKPLPTAGKADEATKADKPEAGTSETATAETVSAKTDAAKAETDDAKVKADDAKVKADDAGKTEAPADATELIATTTDETRVIDAKAGETKVDETARTGPKPDEDVAVASDAPATPAEAGKTEAEAKTTDADQADAGKAGADQAALTAAAASSAAVPVPAAASAPISPEDAAAAEAALAAAEAKKAKADEPVDEPAPKAGPERHSTLFPLIGTLVALAAIAAILIGAMALPIAKASPNAVPVGVAGTDEINSQLTTIMEQFGGDGVFEVHKYSSQKALKSAITHRDVYGGLFVDSSTAEMMIASAAGVEVSDALQSVASALQTQAQASITVTDVVAQPTEDARGDGLSASELPLALVSVLPAIGLIMLYRRRPVAQIFSAILASAGVGLAIAAVFNYGTGSTAGGNFWYLAGGLAAGVFATTVILLGLNAIGGRIGVGIGLAVLILFGAPLSGLGSVPEWLPNPWGTIGQMLPPGAIATLVRSMAFFDGEGSKSALLVLIMWTFVGLLLIGLGTLLRGSNQRLAALNTDEVADLDAAEKKTPVTV